MSLSVFAMACLALWIIGIACIGLSVQLEDDIPTIALVAGGLLLLLWGFMVTPAKVQMGAEAIAVGLLLLSGGHRLKLDSQ